MMKTANYLLSFLLSTMLLMTTSNASADLLISPLRVVLDEKERSSSITLINSGNQIRSYRIHWTQKVALSSGGYRDLTDAEQLSYAGLEKIVRISPKQVTLSPGQRQTVRLLLRNPGNLIDGEYRSHLTFTALPVQTKESSNTAETGIKINVLMGYTMPVVFRTGDVRVAPTIDNLSLLTIKERNATFIKVALSHSDLYSTSGRLVAYWTPRGQSTKQVGIINGYNFYPEVRTTEVRIPWKSFKLESGTLEVRYEGQQEFNGLLLARKALEITPTMVRSVQ